LDDPESAMKYHQILSDEVFLWFESL
jgi:hypothetical protein